VATITAGIICDFANVREGLLSVLSGGLTRIYRPTLPQGLGVMLALMIDVPFDELEQVHEVNVVVKQNDTAKDIARFVAGAQASSAKVEPGEHLLMPLVVNLHGLAIEAYGSYDIRMSVDGNDGPHLTVYVVDELPPGLTEI
jgi:Family of unknown function (DUF6941)